MDGKKVLGIAKEIYESKAYKEAVVKYYDETKRNYWIAACLQKDWIGSSSDMVVKKHTQKVKKFILKKDSPMMDMEYYTHHCPICDGLVFDPKEALDDPGYAFNEPPKL